MTFNLVVSIFWAAYNAIPAALLLHYALAGNKGLKHNIRACSIISAAVMLGVLISVWLLLPPSYDFGKVGTVITVSLQRSCLCCNAAVMLGVLISVWLLLHANDFGKVR